MALITTLKLYVWRQKKDAVNAYKTEQNRRTEEVRENARRAAAKEKRDASRLSDGDLADRLRRRTSDWDRL